ncbi:MAG: UGSC family (seleno)protein [Chloroflexota bacterium]
MAEPGVPSLIRRALDLPVIPTPRPQSLEDRSVLLFDNTKLDFASYSAAFDELADALGARGVQTIRIRQSIRGTGASTLSALANELLASGAKAAVLAFADVGVTPATVLLAIELERRGMPCVVLAGDPGYPLAERVAAYQCPGLPVIHLPLRQSMEAATVRSMLRDRLSEIEDALTSEPSTGRLVPTDQSIPFVTEGAARPAVEVFERLVEAGLTDGLPVLPPSEALVQAMLDHTDRQPEEILIPGLIPSGADLTVANAAVVAVMAGCRPEYFPVVVAALEAMADPRFAVTQAATTANPSANLVLVSGPVAAEIGIQSGAGCLGPGFRANATIGRAINLAFTMVGPVIPGVSDLGVLGSPAEYSYCFAENLEESPWPPLHQQLYDASTTTVTVYKGEAPHTVVDMLSRTPEGLLDGVASTAMTLGGNSAYITSELLVVLCPDHARLIADAGWSKPDVQAYLFEKARIDAASTRGRGQVGVRPAWFAQLDRYPATSSPEEIMVVVAGRHGPHSAVILPWGLNRSVAKPLALKAGRPVGSISEFRRKRT